MGQSTSSDPKRFTREQRIRSSADYRNAFEAGSRISDPCFTLIVRLNGLAMNRLGLAIAKKQIPHATERNRIKRSVREAFRISCSQPVGIDIVVLARSAAAAESTGSLQLRINALWRRVPARLRSPRPPQSKTL